MERQGKQKGQLGNEKGMVLVVTMLLLSVLVVMGTTAIMAVNTDINIAGNFRQNQVALYNAEAGVEQVIAHLRTSTVTYPTASSTPVTITITCPTGFNFNTSVQLHYVAANQYRFQMTGTAGNNASKTIEAYVRKSSLAPQGADGAVAMYGGGPAVTFKTGAGGGYNIDGHDYPIPASSSCTGSGCSTTALSTGATTGLYTVATPTLNGNVAAHLGGVPTQISETTDPGHANYTDQDWIDFVDLILTNNLYQSTFGTRASPAVTVIPSGSTLNGNGHYAGILIVEDGGALNLTGTFTFEGIVILRGSGQMSGRGTGNIFGTTVTTDHESKLLDLTGSVNLFYSSEALANLANLSSLNTRNKTAWRDVK